ncbi:HTH-type transcriptional repressor KstR2 [Mycobacteroides salmoniphilum]|uniref:HTH-type transcriptional repressor KstR2 n=1 Tax=Mycobacteroides salmoniphilum TaxID=404941 RepID=A0A4R8SIT2_9MYCO|nr:TetR/AcrR family transcriptional regulator [Mycobacteroides salmoniphilum]TDZ76720.1 HTH-type transcriptional repressor KstR2 [Mycobacteroides salmoniphilum]TDZ78728.1 HTH-type transcriptional repressor KstR2 [Mycobacteroides salmoniphilum]TDZ85238.1 HTH-type transcriptional repressor KstR2 [Mycobacteroides salmoniphilum]TDZ96822.1 HTH-type transcriptional repressor KstR2 [Mycobacteroides salmoniphilum]TEA05917.1 HTH-type transcriptional repressor KstR2 [Mycobacteroides salmoniphilum]
MTEAGAKPRRGRPPASDGDAATTRRRIMDVATELFAEKGFHATGVAEIGSAAGVRGGALYYHIGSKEELLWEILRSYIDEMLTEAAHIAGMNTAPAKRLRTLIGSYVILIVKYRKQVAIQVRDGSALTGERAAELQELRDELQRCWQRVLDEGHEAGVFRTADHLITNAILGMLNMVAVWYRADGKSPAQIAKRIADMVLDGVQINCPIEPEPTGSD